MDDIILNPVVSRTNTQYKLAHIVGLAGNDTLKIRAGHNLYIPNHWSLHYMNLLLDTDATVANRVMRFSNYVDDTLLIEIKTGNVTASSSYRLGGRKEHNFSTATTNFNASAALSDQSMLIAGNDYIYIWVAAGVAGDTVNGVAMFKWENYNLGIPYPRIQKVKE